MGDESQAGATCAASQSQGASQEAHNRKHSGVYYSDYLGLDSLLSAQNPLSHEQGIACHDEMLFIIVHQVYELWFRQILHELRSVHHFFDQCTVPERDLNTAVQRLARVEKIQNVLLQNLDILETMTPMDFLEFRDLLVPASGFQSMQFREIEILMGLSTVDRKAVDRSFFTGRLKPQHQQHLMSLETKSSLLVLVENWLARMPFSKGSFAGLDQPYDFWHLYQQAVTEMLDREADILQKNAAGLDTQALEKQRARLQSTQTNFESLLDAHTHEVLRSQGQRRFTHQATLNALFIFLYRDEPILQAPFRFLTLLMDIDAHFTTWRYRHAMLAQRMLGVKIGTGGSSGHDYLTAAAKNNRIYLDLFNLSTFLLPRSALPSIPEAILQQMDFRYTQGAAVERTDHGDKGSCA